MKKIIDGREFEYPNNIEFYKGLPVRAVNFIMSDETATVEIITEKPLEFDVVQIKHILTLEEYNNSGITLLGGKKCMKCGAPIT